jgi:hypothetical protein
VKLTFRIPSKMIQYGYVEIEDALDGHKSSPEEVANQYMEAVSRFQMAEMDYVKRKQGEAAAKRDGEEADRRAPERPAAEPPTEAPDEGSEDVDEASKTLAEGLGGVTQVPDEQAPWEKAETPAPASNPWDDGPVFDW